MTADSPSRCTVLTALAAVPVAGMPALADAADADELGPIFALIEAAKVAEAAHNEALHSLLYPAEKQAYAERAKHGDGPHKALEDIYPPLKAAREKLYALSTIQCDAEDAVIDAKSRTRAGLAAQLMFAAEFLAEQTNLGEEGPEFDDTTVLLPLLVNAARMIDSPLVSKIALSDRLAEILSYEDQEA
jgi:hypothetical protein